MKSLKTILPMSVLTLGLMCTSPVYSVADMMDNHDMMKDKPMAMDAMKTEVACDGFCPIAIHEGALVKGSEDFVTVYQGKKYMFVNAQAKEMFMKDPEMYTKDIQMKYEGLMKK